MKSTWKIFWGIAFVLAAVLLLLDAVGILAPFASVIGQVSIFAVVMGVVFFAALISQLAKGKIAGIFFPLAFIFMLFEDNISYLVYCEERNIINNWLLLLIALLLTIGFSILFSKRKKYKFSKQFGSSVSCNGKKVDNSFSSSTVYIDCTAFSKRFIENDFGACTVYFTNPESYSGDSTLIIENDFGSVLIHVPAAWEVSAEIDNNMGSYSIPQKADNGGPVLYIKAENSFGSVNIKYV